MSPRPLTPPCVPTGTRRFNRISAETRTGQGYCSIQPVRVFLSRLPVAHGHFLPCASRLSGNCLPPTPATLVCPVESGSLLSFWASSIVSRYSIGTFCAAIRPTFALLSSYLQSRSNQASPGCRPLPSASPLGHFCPDCGKSALSALPWLSSRTLHEPGRIRPFAPSLVQSPET